MWSIPLPLTGNPVGYVFVYAFSTADGVYIIDSGWDTDECYQALVDGLGQAGHLLADVRGVAVTHVHPDHYGLTGRIREETGAWVGLHPADARLLHDRYEQPAGLLARVRESLVRAGAPDEELDDLQNAALPVLEHVDIATPDVLIEDGDRLDVPGWHITAVWTPGHTPGHLCFYVDESRLMLSGDRVLPRITPNVSVTPDSSPDPLGDYLRSLDRVALWDAELVLPGHEYRFQGLAVRVEQLKSHHEERFTEILTAIDEGVDTPWGIASCMTWSRPWARTSGFMRRAALGEALAHLEALWARGVLRPVDSVPVRWRRA